MPTFFDIETKPMTAEQLMGVMPAFNAPANIKDPSKIAAAIESKQASYIEKAALSPSSGIVQAIGVMASGEDHICVSDEDEKSMLQWFWATIEAEGSTTLVGWNILNFDLPFLVSRSWAHGIRVPILNYYVSYNRYTLPVLDLMQFMCLSRDTRTMSLSSALMMTGLQPKAETKGLLPYELYEQDKEAFFDYLQRDVQALADLYERLSF
jgi:DNA polymerase elongation subunit (family B)